MSSLAFLVTELQSLASETRRKHPEIREAAEKSLAILRSSPEQAPANLAVDGPQSETLLKPVFMGCATKSPKVVAISLGSLQRLITLRAVPQSAIPGILSTMNDVLASGVDIQLRVLQTLVSLIPNFPGVSGPLLAEALLLCFKLQESRIAVVSSTAAATLRQLVMFVVDKMVLEDNILETSGENSQTTGKDTEPAEPPAETSSPNQLTTVALPDGGTARLGPSARDVFSVFEDLCLLANSEKPHFLKLEFLHKTFALELIESVLTNYHALFRKHTELILLLRHHLCPLLLKTLSDRPLFPLMLRCTRVVFLLLKQLSLELMTEAEVFLMLLMRIILGEHGDAGNPGDGNSHNQRPLWMRVLAMEIMRGLCSDAELMRNIYDRYDAQSPGSKVFGALVSALKRLVTERPALLGVSNQMSGIGVQPEGSTSGNALDVVGGMAGRVATGVAGMMGTSVGLSLQGSSMKLQCIDQLDKADSPPIPESYIYLLAVQCLISVSEGLATFTAPLYSSIVLSQRPSSSSQRAPPALDSSLLNASEPSHKHLLIVRAIIESGWPALLAGLSFIIATNLSDELFVDVLASYQALTNVSGMLGLTTPRDAFIMSLAKFAVPTRVVSSLETYIEPPPTPRTATTALSEGLGFSGASGPPSLSERNLACLKVLLNSSMFLAGSLGDSWFNVLEVLQNADYVLTAKGGQSGQFHGTPSKKAAFTPNTPPSGGGVSASRSASLTGTMSQSGTNQTTTKHPLLADLDSETIQLAIQRLFDSSKHLEDTAFKDFVRALCKLSSEMVGMQSGTGGMNRDVSIDIPENPDDTLPGNGSLAPRLETAHRRRVSGIHIPKTLRSGDFGMSKLGGVALLNIHRLIFRSPDIAWDPVTSHLLSIICLPLAPQPIRIQAARVLDEILLVVPKNLTKAGELQAPVQRRVLDVLGQQIIPDFTVPARPSNTSVELRRMGLETLHQILQASGHTLVVGWETIFQMLESVCRPSPPARSASTDSELTTSSPPSPTFRLKPTPLGLGNPSEKSYVALVKIAFQSLTLVCDSVSSLSPEHLRMCISTLGHFGRQADTNIALTAAASLLWSVSDAIQAKRKYAEAEPEYSELWMFLLLEVLGLCVDPRPEVRDGAIQTLFRTMQLYGSTLSADTWDQCVWKVIFPLLESLTGEVRHHTIHISEESSPEQAWDESKILALQSLGSIFHDFLAAHIIHLESFPKAWDVFVKHIQDTVLLDNRSISAPALRCMDKAIKASSASGVDVRPRVSDLLQRVWEAIDGLGSTVLKECNTRQPQSPGSDIPSQPFTQESLVAFVEVIQSTRKTTQSLFGKEWDLERLTKLMAIMKGVLTYPKSPDYRPDIDILPPIQEIVMDTVKSIDLSTPGAPSLVMRDLSEYATLPFMAAFDVQMPPKSQVPQKRITYIAISKVTMPMLVDLFLRFKDQKEIYVDGTLEALLIAYSVPVKLKYDCPQPSKFGKDAPLWKTATSCFLRLVKECTLQVKNFGQDIPNDRVEGIWRQLLDVFRGGILADCTEAENFALEVQEVEENFDLALVASLETDVVPHLGDSRVPDDVVSQLAKILHQGSQIYHSEEIPVSPTSPTSSKSRSHSIQQVNIDNKFDLGSTDSGSLVPRERFSYWCFDLLFLICANMSQDNNDIARKRLAALSLSSLLNRCRSTLVSYVADEALRGNLPFPRAREEELLYVLRKLLLLKLWPGSLWSALSDDPTKYSNEQPAMSEGSKESPLTPSQVIADAVKRSTVGHLFHFYPALCEIASIPRPTPVSRTVPSRKASDGLDASQNEGHSREMDARGFARECLKEVGKEMGVTR